MSAALCFAGASYGGVITFHSRAEDTGDDLVFARGLRREVVDVVTALARHAYDGTTLLVPGLPEADAGTDRVAILENFSRRVAQRLAARRPMPSASTRKDAQ